MTTLAPDGLGPTICVGEILVEIVATTTGDGFLQPQPLLGPYPSGAPAIFIDQCGRFGGAAAMIGAVGDDDFGRINLDRLRRDGVDVTAVSVDTDYPTGSAFVRYRQDGSRDFVFNIKHSAAARFGWTASVEALAEQAGHIHVMGSALTMQGAWEVIGPAVERIKSRGGSVSLDPNLRKELRHDAIAAQRFAWVLGKTDLLLPSSEELQLSAGLADERDAVDRLFSLGVSEIVLKRGALGASCFRKDGTRLDATSFIVEERDPTGAGDCFGGAYVTCRRLGLPVETALTYACAAGARNVTAIGPMEGAGSRVQLDQFIENTERRP